MQRIKEYVVNHPTVGLQHDDEKVLVRELTRPVAKHTRMYALK
jgi:hypothetical protein